MQQEAEQGIAIRSARMAKKMTQAHLAVAAGVSEKTVRRAESGDRIQAESLRSLCAALELDAENLRTESEMIPSLADDMREKYEEQRFLAGVASVILMASFCATLAMGASGTWQFSDAVLMAGKVASYVALGFAAAVLGLAALPATRGFLLASWPVRIMTSGPFLNVAGAVAWVLGIAIVAPMLALFVSAAMEFYDEPSLSGGLLCAFSVYVAFSVGGSVVKMMTGARMNEQERGSTGPEKALS